MVLVQCKQSVVVVVGGVTDPSLASCVLSHFGKLREGG